MSVLADADRIDVILCVDDDVVLVRLVQRLFSRRGQVVEHAADTATGLARVKRGGVAAVILDHDLGGSSGMDFLRSLRDMRESPAIVYVTASSELSVAVEALKLGAVDFMVKTVAHRPTSSDKRPSRRCERLRRYTECYCHPGIAGGSSAYTRPATLAPLPIRPTPSSSTAVKPARANSRLKRSMAALGMLRRAHRRLFDPVSPDKRRERPTKIRVPPAWALLAGECNRVCMNWTEDG